ncbi:EXS family-domain-containing protein [Limtongia smithiae]|uniref:EXS family-domain-containing protein n=1 Tax=Limtongia smithiae TaxID=1125753 RepID=UPI0034CF63A6
MKFARYLSDNLVPEWRIQYLDYKGGKKRLKKLKKGGTPKLSVQISGESNASYSATRSPATQPKAILKTPRFGSVRIREGNESSMTGSQSPAQLEPTEGDRRITPQQLLNAATSIDIPARKNSFGATPTPEAYGSLIATPPTIRRGAFRLPSPALEDDSKAENIRVTTTDPSSSRIPSEPPSALRSVMFSDDPGHDSMPPPLGLGTPALPAISDLGHIASSSRRGSILTTGTPRTPRFDKYSLKKSKYGGVDARSTASRESRAQSLQRIETNKTIMSSMEECNSRCADDPEYRDFMRWLDGQFEKVQSFYQEKEVEAVARFEKIREQLHLLRDQKMREREKWDEEHELQPTKANGKKSGTALEKIARTCYDRWDQFHKKLDLHHLPLARDSANHSEQRDFERRSRPSSVPYAMARRKLKQAVMEYYRGLELLKSYRLLNRTALQKMTKKFDKTAVTKISPWYMDRVTKSYFGQSNVIDDLMGQTEDIFSRYFERGNRKHAIEKLRSREVQPTYYDATFFTGICLGLGIPLFIQALTTAVEKNFRDELDNVPFLLQIFGGGFLITLFGLLFGINCMAWAKNKINYPFIFEFNQHQYLNFREFVELPSFLFFWLAICMYLCFYDYWPDHLPAQWWPLIYVAFSTLVVFNPIPVFHWRAREWLIIALWRLLLSGLYPVEFRDFFLGDIFCSLTYSVSNIDLFFCLYARNWRQDSRCGSSYSRTIGFLNALPPVWRFLQCIRRYADTKNWFPHLANAGKYSLTITTAVVLSVWRINRIDTNRDVYIAFATFNTIYSTFWDLFMDWSLVQTNCVHPLLRDELGFRRPIYYYAAMIIDPLLRLNWIFYVIFPIQVQQSAVTSFLIALSEIVRRFIWIFFRMENEHCSNVGRFQASRNLPLPYEFDSDQEIGHEMAEIDVRTPLMAAEEGRSTGVSGDNGESAQGSNGMPPGTPSISLRRRRSLATMTPKLVANAVSNVIRDAHAQDFERRRRTSRMHSSNLAGEDNVSDDDDILDDMGHDPEADDRSASSDDDGLDSLPEESPNIEPTARNF